MTSGTGPRNRTGGIGRRSFLRAAAGAGAAIAFPTLIPASALGRDGAVAPSERIVLGAIGIRGRGTHDLNWLMAEPDVQFVAICDVRRDRREAVKELADRRYGNRDCAMYRDLREFLAERSDVDAVLIATGDRWHATAAVYAMRAGKDVYCEKPSSMTVAEGQAVVDTARRHGRVYQTGTQRLSEGKFIVANELLRTGRLGRVHTVRAHIAGGSAARISREWLTGEPEPARDEVDWDLWLGPCPWRPYHSSYVQGKWRGYYDFHTGSIGEWGAHTIAQCQVALGLEETAPTRYAFTPDDGGDGMVLTYANGVKLVLQRKGWRGACGVRYEGDAGWVAVADGYSQPEVSSPALLSGADRLLQDYIARTRRPTSHARDFLDCVKSRRPTVANPVVMHRSMSAVHAANICLWVGRDLVYDPAKEEFEGDADANRLRARAARGTWTI